MLSSLRTSIHCFSIFSLLILSLSCQKIDSPDSPGQSNNQPAVELPCDYFDQDRVLVNNPDAEVDYVVTCMMRINGNITIEPGVVIEFEKGAGFEVNPDPGVWASISAVGTSDKPIILRGTKPEKGYWTGIRLIKSGRWPGLNASSNNALEYVTLQDAGNDDEYGSLASGGIVSPTFSDDANINLILRNSKISNCKNFGLNFKGMNFTPTFKNNKIIKNDVPIVIQPDYVRHLDVESDYKGNNIDLILIDATGYVDNFGNRHTLPVKSYDPLTHTVTWNKLNVPYKLDARYNYGLYIATNLVISAGVEIIMVRNSNITVGGTAYGSMNLKGSASQRIVIRGEQDAPDFWGGIVFFNNGYHKISYTEIKNGGKPLDNSSRKAVLHLDNGSFDINNTSFVNCIDFAISLISFSELGKDDKITTQLRYSNLKLINTPEMFSDQYGNPVDY